MKHELLEQGFRWYGVKDEVPLQFIRQAGAESVFTSLHDIPYGEVWTSTPFGAQKELLRTQGLLGARLKACP